MNFDTCIGSCNPDYNEDALQIHYPNKFSSAISFQIFIPHPKPLAPTGRQTQWLSVPTQTLQMKALSKARVPEAAQS